MARDYYADAQAVAEQLWCDGLSATANLIHDAIEKGYTATEILMGVRWQLAQVDLSDQRLRSDTRVAVMSLVKALDEALA